MKKLLALILLLVASPLQAEIALRQSTASQEVPLGYFVDSTDGNTEETALTIANTDIKVWKNGATTLANKNSGGATHISNGIYYAVLDATDTDTVGPLVIFVHVSGALTVRLECVVYDEPIYDGMIAAGGTIPVDALKLSGDSVAADNAESFFDGTGYGPLVARTTVVTQNTATNFTISTLGGFTGNIQGCIVVIRGVGTAVRAITNAADAGSGTVNITIDSTPGFTPQDGNVVDVLSLGVSGTGSTLTAIPWNAVWDTEVQSEANDAIVANGLQTIRSGTAQAGAANTITLDTGASAVTNFYRKRLIYLTGGLGAGQVRGIVAYNGTTKVASVFEPWAIQPDITTTFVILPIGQ